VWSEWRGVVVEPIHVDKSLPELDTVWSRKYFYSLSPSVSYSASFLPVSILVVFHVVENQSSSEKEMGRPVKKGV